MEKLLHSPCPHEDTVFFATTPRANSPKVKPLLTSTTSSRLGWVNTAKVFLVGASEDLRAEIFYLSSKGTGDNLQNTLLLAQANESFPSLPLAILLTDHSPNP